MNTATDHVRLFVACEVPDDARETIGEIIETLKGRSGSAVRWIRPEGVHVTLKFLGEVPVRQLPAIKLGIQEAVVGHSPFELEFSNIGTFGGREGLRIMWVGIAGDVLRLEALVRAVNAALAVVGFEPERRPFRPHLTLGRVRDEISTRQRAEIEVAVVKMDVGPDGRGQLKLDGLDPDKDVIVAISGLTRGTVEVGKYEYSVSGD